MNDNSVSDTSSYESHSRVKNLDDRCGIIEYWKLYANDNASSETVNKYVEIILGIAKDTLLDRLRLGCFVANSGYGATDYLKQHIAILTEFLGTCTEDNLWEFINDRQEIAEALAVTPHMFSYCLHRSCNDRLAARLKDSLDNLDRHPEDVSLSHAIELASSKAPNDNVRDRYANFWLRQEVSAGKELESALLSQVDCLMEREAPDDVLYRWIALPMRWRFYILRDSFISTNQVPKRIEELLEADLAGLVLRIFGRLGSEFDALSCDSNSRMRLPLRFYLDVLRDTGIVLLPRTDAELANLLPRSKTDHRFRLLDLIDRISPCKLDQTLSTTSSVERTKLLMEIRALCEPRAIGDSLGNDLLSIEPSQILDLLPVSVSIRDHEGQVLYANEIARRRSFEGKGNQGVERSYDYEVLTTANTGPISRVDTRLIEGRPTHDVCFISRLPRKDNGVAYVLDCRTRLTKTIEERNTYAAAADAFGIGIWHRDLTRNDSWFSSGWKSMLGFRDDELPNTHDTWLSRIHEQDKQRVLDALDGYICGRSNRYAIEYRLKHKEHNRYVWVQSRGVLSQPYGVHGPKYLSGVHVDVTEYRTQGVFEAQALDSMEEVYVFAKDSDLKFTYANASLKRALGLDPLGMTDSELFDDNRSVRLFNSADRRVFETLSRRVGGEEMKAPPHLRISEEYFDDHEGNRRWLATVKQPVFLPNGKVQLLGISMDITELRLLKLFFEASTSSSNDLVWFKDRNGRFVMTNEAFGKKFDGSLVGRSDSELFPKAYAEEWKSEEASLIQEGKSIIDDARLVFDSGRPRIRMVSKMPVMSSQGDVEGVLGIAKDITPLILEFDELWYGVMAVQPYLNDSQFAVFLKDKFGRIVAHNRVFATRHEHVTGSLIGKTDFEFWPEEQANRYSKMDRSILVDNCTPVPFFEDQMVGDKRRVLLTLKRPIMGSQRKPIAIIGVYKDVSDFNAAFGFRGKSDLEKLMNEIIEIVLDKWPHKSPSQNMP